MYICMYAHRSPTVGEEEMGDVHRIPALEEEEMGNVHRNPALEEEEMGEDHCSPAVEEESMGTRSSRAFRNADDWEGAIHDRTRDCGDGPEGSVAHL